MEDSFCIANNVGFEKELLARFSVHKFNALFFELKDIIYFEADSFYILKSNQYKNWHPAIGQIDLMEAIDVPSNMKKIEQIQKECLSKVQANEIVLNRHNHTEVQTAYPKHSNNQLF